MYLLQRRVDSCPRVYAGALINCRAGWHAANARCWGNRFAPGVGECPPSEPGWAQTAIGRRLSRVPHLSFHGPLGTKSVPDRRISLSPTHAFSMVRNLRLRSSAPTVCILFGTARNRAGARALEKLTCTATGSNTDQPAGETGKLAHPTGQARSQANSGRRGSHERRRSQAG
jgi:hypothetical protein